LVKMLQRKKIRNIRKKQWGRTKNQGNEIPQSEQLVGGDVKKFMIGTSKNDAAWVRRSSN